MRIRQLTAAESFLTRAMNVATATGVLAFAVASGTVGYRFSLAVGLVVLLALFILCGPVETLLRMKNFPLIVRLVARAISAASFIVAVEWALWFMFSGLANSGFSAHLAGAVRNPERLAVIGVFPLGFFVAYSLSSSDTTSRKPTN